MDADDDVGVFVLRLRAHCCYGILGGKTLIECVQPDPDDCPTIQFLPDDAFLPHDSGVPERRNPRTSKFRTSGFEPLGTPVKRMVVCKGKDGEVLVAEKI